MALIQRIQDILLKPRETWPVIDREPADVPGLFTQYVMILALIPAVAEFIGGSLIGVGGFGFSVRVPLLSGLVSMVISYLMSLLTVFVVALIVDALAPTFGGVKNQVQAVKVVAYSMTAGFLGGIFLLIPSLGVLGLLASLYGIYLLYLGLPVLMRAPTEKAPTYTAAVVVVVVVVTVVLSAIAYLVLPSPSVALGRAAGGGDVVVNTPNGELRLDTARMEAAAKRLEAAGKQVDAAQKAQDPAAASRAMGEMMSAIGGKAPIAAQDLKALLPESLGDMKRESYEATGGQAGGLGGSSAKARYAAGDKSVQLSITDLGGLGGLAALAGWANVTLDKDTGEAVEKVYKQGRRTLREQYRKDGSQGEVMVILDNGVMVEASGQGVDIGGLKGMVAGIDLARIESLKRAAN